MKYLAVHLYPDDKTSCESIVYLIFELAKTLLNVALGCLNFD